MGIIILKRRYNFSKYLSVLMITAGIVICTIVSGSNVVSKQSTRYLFIEKKERKIVEKVKLIIIFLDCSFEMVVEKYR